MSSDNPGPAQPGFWSEDPAGHPSAEGTFKSETRNPDSPDQQSGGSSAGETDDRPDGTAIGRQNDSDEPTSVKKELNDQASPDPGKDPNPSERETIGEYQDSGRDPDPDIRNDNPNSAIETPIAHPAAERADLPIARSQDNLFGIGSGTNGKSDFLYFLSSKDNLRYLLSQGYIGPIYNRKLHKDDFLKLYKGSALLLSPPIGQDAVEYVSENRPDINSPFAIRIPISDLEGHENTSGIDQNGNVAPWNLETPGVVGALVSGAIPLSSETTIFARSDSELANLTRGMLNNPQVPYDRYQFKTSQTGDVFSDSNSNIGSLLDTFKKNELDDSPSQVDNRLDRLAGGFASALWLSSIEGSDTEPLGLLCKWISAAINGDLDDQDATNRLIRSFHESILIMESPEQKGVDLWVFEQITSYLLSLQADIMGWQRPQLLDALEAKLEGANLDDQQKEYITKSLEYIRKFMGGDAPSIYEFFKNLPDPENFKSLRSLLLTVVSISSDVTPNGLKRFLEEPTVDQRQLLLAALWIGLITGRRSVETQYRPEELDKVLSRWTASQLTGGQFRTSWKDNHQIHITPNLQTHNGDEVKLAIGLDVILQRRYAVRIPTLKEMFTDGDRESQTIKEAALYLCKSVKDFDNCIRTKVTYPASQHIATTTIKKRPLTFTLDLEGSFTPEEAVDWGGLLSGLDSSEGRIPDDIKTEVAKMITPDADDWDAQPT